MPDTLFGRKKWVMKLGTNVSATISASYRIRVLRNRVEHIFWGDLLLVYETICAAYSLIPMLRYTVQ